MKNIILLTSIITASATFSSAVNIVSYTFDNLANNTTALESSSIFAGLTATGLTLNPIVNNVGVEVLPPTAGPTDGIGFGGATQVVSGQLDKVAFLHRAAISGTTLYSGNNSNLADSYFSFTLTAGANDVNITGFNAALTSGKDLIVSFAELNGTSNSILILEDNTNPVFGTYQSTVAAGTSKTYVIDFNTGDHGSIQNLNEINIIGNVVPEPSAALLGAIGALALLRRRRVS